MAMSENEYVQLLEANHNLVLTGAPGTGKTYLAKEIAKAMGATEEKGNLKMVQFHPSYDYTDFVEGLRPKERGAGFKRINGVFKEFCKDAIMDAIIPDEDFIKAHLMGHKYAFNYNNKRPFHCVIEKYDEDTRCFSWKGTEHEGINPDDQIINLDTISTIIKRCRGGEQLCEIIDAVSKDEKNQSQYFTCAASAICDDILKNWVFIIKKWVFIIDEINRGELSKIFGELFFSIDPGYRGVKGRVETQYQNLVKDTDPFKNGFYVPENVYIIGTMNDIDRSVESMDFAIRRRFAWCEVETSSRKEMLDDLGKDLAEKAKNSMEALNAAIVNAGLTSAYHIGPAYYLKLKNYDGNFESLWDYHIKGLLFEYLRGNKGIEKKLIELKEAFDAYKQA